MRTSAIRAEPEGKAWVLIVDDKEVVRFMHIEEALLYMGLIHVQLEDLTKAAEKVIRDHNSLGPHICYHNTSIKELAQVLK